jgi:hypothetical protein
MTENVSHPTPQPQTNRRRMLAALPALVVSETMSLPLANATDQDGPPPTSCDSEHIRRFYELARF